MRRPAFIALGYEMRKFLVGKSIARAYGYLLGRVFSIVGLAWLPALIYAGGCFYLLQNFEPILAGARAGTGGLLQAAIGCLALFIIVLLLHATIAISLTQDALGVRKDIALAHLVVGPRELRLFMAYVRVYLAFYVGFFAIGLLSSFAVAEARNLAQTGDEAQAGLRSLQALPAAIEIVAFVVGVTFLLAILRFAFLLGPIAAVEHRASLLQSWRLTKGNAWRIVAILLAIFVPVWILSVSAIWFFSGDVLRSTLHDMLVTQPPNGKALMQFEAAHAFVFAAVGGISLVVASALQAGATAAAYRTVTGHEEEESEDDAALVAPLLTPAASLHDEHHGHDMEPDHASDHQPAHDHDSDRGHNYAATEASAFGHHDAVGVDHEVHDEQAGDHDIDAHVGQVEPDQHEMPREHEGHEGSAVHEHVVADNGQGEPDLGEHAAHDELPPAHDDGHPDHDEHVVHHAQSAPDTDENYEKAEANEHATAA